MLTNWIARVCFVAILFTRMGVVSVFRNSGFFPDWWVGVCVVRGSHASFMGIPPRGVALGPWPRGHGPKVVAPGQGPGAKVPEVWVRALLAIYRRSIGDLLAIPIGDLLAIL